MRLSIESTLCIKCCSRVHISNVHLQLELICNYYITLDANSISDERRTECLCGVCSRGQKKINDLLSLLAISFFLLVVLTANINLFTDSNVFSNFIAFFHILF